MSLMEKYINKIEETVGFKRVWEHSKTGCCTISAFKTEKTFKENLAKNEELKQEIRELGMGYFEVDGVYEYDDGTVGFERTFFVPFKNRGKIDTFDKFVEAMNLLGQMFGQQSVLIKEPDVDDRKGVVYLLYGDGRKRELGNEPAFDKISADGWTRMRKGSYQGRTFTFRWGDVREQG